MLLKSTISGPSSIAEASSVPAPTADSTGLSGFSGTGIPNFDIATDPAAGIVYEQDPATGDMYHVDQSTGQLVKVFESA